MTASPVPAVLREFDAADWSPAELPAQASDWMVLNWSVLGRFAAWKQAREAWADEHGAEAMGTPLGMLRLQRAIRQRIVREMCDNQIKTKEGK